jgi:hypothetical protein
MFNSLKKQQRVRVSGQRRTMSCKPVRSGRAETTIAASDEGDLIALSNAKRRGQPMYFIRTGDGVTLDVLLDKAVALRTRDVIRERIHNGRPNINAYERVGGILTRI